MRLSAVVLALFALILLAPAAGAQSLPGDPGVDKGVFPDTELHTPPIPPEGGFITLDERFWTTTLSDEPQLKLHEALDKLAAGDRKGAAQDILKAAAHSHVAGARSFKAEREQLAASEQELRVLAKKVHSGEITSADALTPAFARDLQALAQHHAARAALHWNDGHGIDTGYDLKAAAMDLTHALKWAGRDGDTETLDMLTVAETASDQLIAEEKVDHEQITRLIDATNQKSRELGDLLRAGKS
jgi:hypothetical protein